MGTVYLTCPVCGGREILGSPRIVTATKRPRCIACYMMQLMDYEASLLAVSKEREQDVLLQLRAEIPGIDREVR